MASKPKNRARKPAAREQLVDLVDDMEMPLARVGYLVTALEYIGYGLHSLGDDASDAVIGIAVSLADDLAVVKTARLKMIKAL